MIELNQSLQTITNNNIAASFINYKDTKVLVYFYSSGPLLTNCIQFAVQVKIEKYRERQIAFNYI